MGRMMVAQRKGAPPVDDAADTGPDDATAGDAPDGQDVETCPNCECQFVDSDDGQPEVIKPGKKVEGDTAGYKNQGEDLDASGSAQPVPGPQGAAHDAALGQSVMAALLGGAHGMPGTRP